MNIFLEIGPYGDEKKYPEVYADLRFEKTFQKNYNEKKLIWKNYSFVKESHSVGQNGCCV
jgi:hypothetical protein